MKRIIIQGIRWAVAVAKKAITRAVVELLGTVIFALGVKMWLLLTTPAIWGV